MNPERQEGPPEKVIVNEDEPLVSTPGVGGRSRDWTSGLTEEDLFGPPMEVDGG